MRWIEANIKENLRFSSYFTPVYKTKLFLQLLIFEKNVLCALENIVI